MNEWNIQVLVYISSFLGVDEAQIKIQVIAYLKYPTSKYFTQVFPREGIHGYSIHEAFYGLWLCTTWAHKSTWTCSCMNYSPSVAVTKGSMGELTNVENPQTHSYLREKSSMQIAWLVSFLWGLELPGLCWSPLPPLLLNSFACITLHSTESNSISLFFFSFINWLLSSAE